jgi:large conductance mechanosensitive channel
VDNRGCSGYSTAVKIMNEFREFISRGNVIDLAVGVIIGGAFGKITTSLVNDIIMPPIGAAMQGISFNNLLISLDGRHYDTLAAARDAGAPVIAYGSFINTTVQFLIIAACIFAMVKTINAIRRQPPPASAEPPAPTRSEVLLEEIRDSLRK